MNPNHEGARIRSYVASTIACTALLFSGQASAQWLYATATTLDVAGVTVTPRDVITWKMVRSPSSPRNIGLLSAEIFFVVDENDHHVSCAAAPRELSEPDPLARIHWHESTGTDPLAPCEEKGRTVSPSA